MVKLNETGLGETYAKLLNDKGYSFSANFTDKIVDILFSGSVQLLKDMKSTDKPAAVVIEDLKGEPVFAIVCKYNSKEDDQTVAGNWEVFVSFDKNDFKEEETKVIKIVDNMATVYYFNYAMQKYGMKFNATEYLTVMLVDLAVLISQFLNDNTSKATDDEPFIVSLDKVVELIVDNKGNKAIEIMPEIKKLVKDDDVQ